MMQVTTLNLTKCTAVNRGYFGQWDNFGQRLITKASQLSWTSHLRATGTGITCHIVHIILYSIYLPQRDGRLSWPRLLRTYRDGLPVSRQSPIQVVTGPDVE